MGYGVAQQCRDHRTYYTRSGEYFATASYLLLCSFASIFIVIVVQNWEKQILWDIARPDVTRAANWNLLNSVFSFTKLDFGKKLNEF